jgi:hypothetical protein
MISQKGGLKRKDSVKHLSNTDVLLSMINSKDATLEFLGNPKNSSRGIIAILNVKPENSQYTGLNPKTGRLDLEVTSFVIKFAITTHEGNDRLEYNNITKTTESQQSFLNEAKLQQDIWLQSILGRKPAIEICPSIGSLLLLNNGDAQTFLTGIPNSHVKHLLQGFIRDTSISPGLGILLMQNVAGAKPLSFVLSHYSLDNVSILIAQIVRLLIFFKVIHFDLHEENELFSFDSGEINPMCKLIDFGLASNVSDLDEDDYLTTPEKEEILANIKNFMKKYNELSGDITIEDDDYKQDKIQFMSDVMNYLTMWDRNKYHELYQYSLKGITLKIDENGDLSSENGALIIANRPLEQVPLEQVPLEQVLGSKRPRPDPEPVMYFLIPDARNNNRYQMSWYEMVKSNPKDADFILLKAFELLQQITSVNIDRGEGLRKSTIQTYLKSGELFDVSTIILPKKCVVKPSSSGCSIMGGKRKTKKHKKSKKSKKSKKNKKLKNKI